MELSFAKKLFYFFPVLFCFCLPFGSLLLSGIIVVWVIFSFFNLDVVDLTKGLRKKELWLFYLFFLITVVSAALSENRTEALFSIEVKMSFLLFPYLMFCFRWPLSILKRCVISFVSGCFFACLYLIARAVLYSLNGHPEYFFYTMFSDLIHASYFSMYLILAIIFVTVFYQHWFESQKSVIYSSYFFVVVFIASIFLCSSKLGLISFFICVPLVLIYRFRKHLNLKKGLFFFLALVLGAVGMAKMMPGSFGRLNSLRTLSIANIDKTSAESTTVRVLIWQQAINLVKANFLFGTGVGDANDELYRAYDENGLTGAFKNRLNAHNQFFQTFIGMGIIGFFSLLLLTLGQLIYSIRTKQVLLFLFSLLVIMNFFVESMLQSSAGVLFFVFFLCFFGLVDEKDLSDGSLMDPAVE